MYVAVHCIVMESSIVPFQPVYSYTLFDPSQPISVESSLSRHRQFSDIITLSQDDFNCVLEWAYPDVAYRGNTFPVSEREAFPAAILAEIQRMFGTAGYASYEVRFNEEKKEYVLIGLQGKRRFVLAQWRENNEVRSIRELIDDVTPFMKQFIARHGRIGKLALFLGASALACSITYIRFESLTASQSLVLWYAACTFASLAGAALAWFGLNYMKFQSATVAFEIETIEDDPVGVVFW